jgi:hypothetical protein
MTPRAIHVMPNEGKSLIELLEREAKATRQPEGLYARLAADLRDQWGIKAETGEPQQDQEREQPRARSFDLNRAELVIIRL